LERIEGGVKTSERKGGMDMRDEKTEEAWWVEEFAGVSLGDPRRTERLIEIAAVLSKNLHASLPQAFAGNPHPLKAAYRFFQTEAIDPEDLHEAHHLQTLRRCQAFPLVLAVQDTTELDFSHHPATTGLGYTKNRHVRGLLMHTTLAFTNEGVALGHLRQDVWTRDDEERGKSYQRKQKESQQKESRKWLDSLETTDEARAFCPNTTFVNVADREGDLYDLFAAPRRHGVELLVRAAQDRRVRHVPNEDDIRAETSVLAAKKKAAKKNEEPSEVARLWTVMTSKKVQATWEVELSRRGGKNARTACVHVRFCEVKLQPPKARAKEKAAEIPVYAVLLQEVKPAKTEEAVEWLLLTTKPVLTEEDAVERARWYAARWGIELYHKVLKSGCQLEELQLEEAERIHRCVAVYTVMAWRLMYGTMLARAVPTVGCECWLSSTEWKALYCAVFRTTTPPASEPSLKEAVSWLALLGGFLARKCDGHPGLTVVWRGLARLHDLTLMYQIFRPDS
jgi:hypothetical protein